VTRRQPLIVPVLDIKGGDVVAATGGDRKKYKPVRAPIFTSSDPVSIVKRYNALFNFNLFYVADLDAITGNGDNSKSISQLLGMAGYKFLIDGGYKKLSDIQHHHRGTPIIATETFMQWDSSESLSGTLVSIDTNGENLISPVPNATVKQILQKARRRGAKRFIHLKLDVVGTENFAQNLLIPPQEDEEWFAGGGVRSQSDLQTLAATGYAGALVATALYKGSLP